MGLGEEVFDAQVDYNLKSLFPTPRCVTGTELVVDGGMIARCG
jgi:hypothetical protein